MGDGWRNEIDCDSYSLRLTATTSGRKQASSPPREPVALPRKLLVPFLERVPLDSPNTSASGAYHSSALACANLFFSTRRLDSLRPYPLRPYIIPDGESGPRVDDEENNRLVSRAKIEAQFWQRMLQKEQLRTAANKAHHSIPVHQLLLGESSNLSLRACLNAGRPCSIVGREGVTVGAALPCHRTTPSHTATRV